MKLLSSLLIFTLLSFRIFAQCDGRYQDEIFNTVSVNTVYYSDVYFDESHKMDIYLPDGDTVAERPVVVYLFGGAFLTGSKNNTDCVDFCNYFAKRGYVAIAANYRLSNNPILFSLDQNLQYSTVLKAMADLKSVIRYIKKDYIQSNILKIDTNSIFAGGYSAGAVTAIHSAYVDNISDLPISPVNVQSIANNIGGSLEGDAGNFGYSSRFKGIFSYAGGLNDLSWIDSDDEPIFAAHGTNDNVVNFNCGPAFNLITTLDLCGIGEMSNVLAANGIIYDELVFNGIDHYWPVNGTGNSNFSNALLNTKNFLYDILPCNTTLRFIYNSKTVNIYPNPTLNNIHIELNNNVIKLINIYDLYGNKLEEQTSNNISLVNYSNGTYFLEILTKNSSILKKVIKY
jgi:para-nitrobenzyl esterase